MLDKKQVIVIRKVKNLYTTLLEQVGGKKGMILHTTGVACIGNTFVGLSKLVMGIVAFSLFTCMSAFYTFGMIIAKLFALFGLYKTENRKQQYHYYMVSGIILIIASIIYILYSIRLFYYPETLSYDRNVGIAIATFTFIELGINIRGVLRERHNDTPLFHAIKMINLASSLICLVLTQTALLSFAYTDDVSYNYSTANGFMGILMGTVATILGIIMIFRINKMKKQENYSHIFNKVKILAKKNGLFIKMKPIRFEEDCETEKQLYVTIVECIIQSDFMILQSYAETELKIKLYDINRTAVFKADKET